MKALTQDELNRMTRSELVATYRRIADALPTLPVGSQERSNAYTNLDAIKRSLSRPRLSMR